MLFKVNTKSKIPEIHAAIRFVDMNENKYLTSEIPQLPQIPKLVTVILVMRHTHYLQNACCLSSLTGSKISIMIVSE